MSDDLDRGVFHLFRIGIVSRSFPPAYLHGGPARGLGGLVKVLGSDFAFSVITSCFDGPGTDVMEGVLPDQWESRSSCEVWCSSARPLRLRRMLCLLEHIDPDVVFINSLFDSRFSLIVLLGLRTLRRKVPVLLAPRGELSRGALALHSVRKTVFIRLFRLLRLDTYVDWQASADLEKQDIRRVFGPRARVHVAGELRPDLVSALCSEKIEVGEGSGCGHRLVFLSRIVRKKNLRGLLEAVALLDIPFQLSIAGPIEDERYWEECRRVIGGMRHPGRVQYVGVVPAQDTVSFLSSYDLLVLPTLGENFGHVVLESLAAGTPVVVGRDTPWGVISEEGAGWLCDPLSSEGLAATISNFISLNAEQMLRMRANSKRVALKIASDEQSVSQQIRVFNELASRRAR